MSFEYQKPKTADALAQLLAQAGTRACLLAGGTDLLVQLRSRTISPELIVDIKAVEELAALQHLEGGGVLIGAAVPVNRIYDNARLRPAMAGLCDACGHIATYAIRNRATVTGNVANASPCADTVPALCVLDAVVQLRSQTGARELPVQDFILGVRRTARRPDEYVEAIVVPAPAAGTRTFFRKRQRIRGHDLALVNAALLHDPQRKRLRLAIGSCSPAPIVLQLDDLIGSLDAEEAARRAMEAIAPINDVRASAEYRTDMTGVLVRRLFDDLKG